MVYMYRDALAEVKGPVEPPGDLRGDLKDQARETALGVVQFDLKTHLAIAWRRLHAAAYRPGLAGSAQVAVAGALADGSFRRRPGCASEDAKVTNDACAADAVAAAARAALTMSARLLDVSAVTKRFGAFVAVDAVSFSVEDGEVLGGRRPEWQRRARSSTS